jgi:nucleoporin NUP159
MDAVKKTIIKMTALAERRNNDIALLESQMRRVGLNDGRPTSSSSPANGAGATTPRRARGTDLRKSIADTPFTTPPTRGKMSLSDLNRRALTPEVQDSTPSKGYGLFYDASETAGGNDLARLSDMVDDNIEELRQTARRRRAVASGLRKVLLERGVKSTSVA